MNKHFTNMIINGKELSLIKYTFRENWAANIPTSNWLCILIYNDSPQRHIDEVIGKIIDRDVCYVCTLGESCERIHDLIDEEIVYRDMDIEQLHVPDHVIMTTWHSDPEEGIRFALFAARHEEVAIHTIVLLDMTNGRDLNNVCQLLADFRTDQ